MTGRAPRAAVAALAAAGAAVTLSGCAIADQHRPVVLGAATTVVPTPTTVPSTPSSKHLTEYLVDSQGLLVAVARAGPYSGLNVAIGDLLAGPTSEEVAAGITSAVPAGTKLTYASLSGAVANLDFSSDLAQVSGHEQLLAFAQIVETAASTPGVRTVLISVAGEVVNAPRPDGTLAQGPVAASDYASLLRH